MDAVTSLLDHSHRPQRVELRLDAPQTLRFGELPFEVQWRSVTLEQDELGSAFNVSLEGAGATGAVDLAMLSDAFSRPVLLGGLLLEARVHHGDAFHRDVQALRLEVLAAPRASAVLALAFLAGPDVAKAPQWLIRHGGLATPREVVDAWPRSEAVAGLAGLVRLPALEGDVRSDADFELLLDFVAWTEQQKVVDEAAALLERAQHAGAAHFWRAAVGPGATTEQRLAMLHGGFDTDGLELALALAWRLRDEESLALIREKVMARLSLFGLEDPDPAHIEAHMASYARWQRLAALLERRF